MERQDLSCTYLAHHELESTIIVIVNILIMIIMDCLQVALVAGTTFTVVEILAAVLFLATRDDNNNGYSPSSKMVILHMFTH